MDHQDIGRPISRAPSPEETARAYFEAHGDFSPEPIEWRGRKWAIRAGIVLTILVVALAVAAFSLRSHSPPSSASTGTVPTTTVTVPTTVVTTPPSATSTTG